MQNYDYNIRRIERKNTFEQWLLYVSEAGEDLYQDHVLIFFKENQSIIYLLTAYPERLKDESYGTVLEGIYHDIGVCEEEEYEFELKVEILPKELLNQEEEAFDEYLDKKMQELVRLNESNTSVVSNEVFDECLRNEKRIGQF